MCLIKIIKKRESIQMLAGVLTLLYNYQPHTAGRENTIHIYSALCGLIKQRSQIHTTCPHRCFLHTWHTSPLSAESFLSHKHIQDPMDAQMSVIIHNNDWAHSLTEPPSMMKNPVSELIFSEIEEFRTNHPKVVNLISSKSLKALKSFHCLTHISWWASLVSTEH